MFDQHTRPSASPARFTSYKLPELLFIGRPIALAHSERTGTPLPSCRRQAHPADEVVNTTCIASTGSALESEVRLSIAFLDDYDLHVRALLVQGPATL